jgi:hypothetical protein
MKAVLDTLDGVAEGVAGEYEQGEDGKFYLKLEGHDAHPVIVSVVSDANKAVGDFRSKNVGLNGKVTELETTLKRFEGIDPDAVAKDRERIKELEAKGVKKSDDINAIVTQAVQAAIGPLQAKVEESEKARLEAVRNGYQTKLESALTAAAVSAGVAQHAVPDFLARGKQAFRVGDSGSIEAVNPDGTPRFSPKRPGEILSVEEYAVGLQAEAPHLYKPNVGGNADSGGTGGNGKPNHTGQTIPNDPREIGRNLDKVASGEIRVQVQD